MPASRSERRSATAAHHPAFRAQVGDLVVAEVGRLQPGFHEGQCLFGSRNPVQHDVGPGQGELQPRIRLHDGGRQLAHQPDQRGHLRIRHQVDAVVLDELHRPLFITGGQRVIDRLADQLVLGEPRRGHAVQPHDPLGLVTAEPVPQEVEEQLVVAEPLLVDPAQEQVALLDLFEHRLPVRHAGQRRRQVPADALGDRGGQQEVEHRRFQGVEHVLGEELADRVVAAGHRADQPDGIVAAAQRQRCQLQCGHPAVRLGGELLDVGVVQVQPTQVDQKVLRFGHVETQCGGVDFDQFVLHPHPAHRQAALVAAGHHHASTRQRRRRVGSAAPRWSPGR